MDSPRFRIGAKKVKSVQRYGMCLGVLKTLRTNLHFVSEYLIILE